MTEPSLPPERPYPLDHEGRIARLEGIIEQVDVRLGRVETKLDANRQAIDDTRKELETKIDATRESLETKVDANRQAIDANRQAINDTRKELLRWVIALHVATWGLIGALKLFG